MLAQGGAKERTPVKGGGIKGADGKKETAYVDNSRHPRWKTELCTHWLMHGSCSYGKERCNFAHGEDDLRQPPGASEDVAAGAVGAHKGKDMAYKPKPPPLVVSPSRARKAGVGAPPSWSPVPPPMPGKRREMKFIPSESFGSGDLPESPDAASIDSVSDTPMYSLGGRSAPFAHTRTHIPARTRAHAHARTHTHRHMHSRAKPVHTVSCICPVSTIHPLLRHPPTCSLAPRFRAQSTLLTDHIHLAVCSDIGLTYIERDATRPPRWHD